MSRMRIMEIENSRVLITGGAGLIGSHIADRLVWNVLFQAPLILSMT